MRAFALAIYLVAYLGLAFVWRSVLVYRRTGQNPLVLTSEDDAYGYVGRAFKIVIAACVVVVGLNFHPSSASWVGPLSKLEIPALVIAGWLLLIASLLWVLIAQAQMGASWRIGIDSENRTDLVQVGLFRISRNPIFLSMRVTLLGLFLVVPSAATIGLLLVGEVLIQVQVRLEEVHLTQLHGSQYRAYRARVRRWL